MSDLTDLQARLREQRPVTWDQLPDFSLYMDQVLSYMDRQVIRFDESDVLTAAMVNNYTKSGLVPRAEGKKYNREHLAYLTAICVLKRVMSTRDMDLLIREELQGERQGPADYRRRNGGPGGRRHPGGQRHSFCPVELCRRRGQQPLCGPAAGGDGAPGPGRPQKSQKGA